MSTLDSWRKTAVQHRELSSVLWDDPEGWNRGRVGTGVGGRLQRGNTCIHMGFPGGSDSKESACNAGNLGSVPVLGRSPGGGNGNLLQYSCLENPMDSEAWWATVHGGHKSQTRLSNETTTTTTTITALQEQPMRMSALASSRIIDNKVKTSKAETVFHPFVYSQHSAQCALPVLAHI